MKTTLLAIAAALASLATGSIVFIRWSDTTQVPMPQGTFELVNPAACTGSPCNNAQCVATKNVLSDAGSPCTVLWVDCPMRVGNVAADQSADAGLVTGTGYRQIKFVAMKCGSNFAVAVDDAGFPMFSILTGTPGCAKRDAGLPVSACSRLDGGDQGDDNQQPASELTGPLCTPVPCGIFAGDQAP